MTNVREAVAKAIAAACRPAMVFDDAGVYIDLDIGTAADDALSACAHQEMVEALDELLMYCSLKGFNPGEANACRQARAALAKARGDA